MRKLILYLIVTILLFNGCSKEDSINCDIVAGRSIAFGMPDIYSLKINGDWMDVSKDDYLEYKVGDTYCY